MIITVLLICCSLPHTVTLTPVTYGENLTRPEPRDENEFGRSRANIENCLPYYTAGFE